MKLANKKSRVSSILAGIISALCLATLVSGRKFDLSSDEVDSYAAQVGRRLESSRFLDDFIPVGVIKALQNFGADPRGCFEKAAKYIKPGCEDLERDSGRDTKALLALQFTECELKSAALSLPRQCRQIIDSFYEFERLSFLKFESPVTESIISKWESRSGIHGGLIEDCVKAISQTPQLWTSYSGYFRNMQAICRASRGVSEKAYWEALHKNWTAAQLLHYRLLHSQNVDMATSLKSQHKTLTDISSKQQQLSFESDRLLHISNSTLQSSQATLASVFETQSLLQQLRQTQSDLKEDVKKQTEWADALTRRLVESARESTGAVAALSYNVNNVSKELDWLSQLHGELRKQLSEVFQNSDALAIESRAQALELQSTLRNSTKLAVDRFNQIDALQQSHFQHAIAFYESAAKVWEKQNLKLNSANEQLEFLEGEVERALYNQVALQRQLGNITDLQERVHATWMEMFERALQDLAELSRVSKDHMEHLSAGLNQSTRQFLEISRLLKPITAVSGLVAYNVALVGNLASTIVLAILLYVLWTLAMRLETSLPSRNVAYVFLLLVVLIHYLFQPSFGWSKSLQYAASALFLLVASAPMHSAIFSVWRNSCSLSAKVHPGKPELEHTAKTLVSSRKLSLRSQKVKK